MKVGYIKINKQRVLLVGLFLGVGAIALRQPLNRQGVSRYCISSEQGVPVASNNKRQEVQGIIAHKKIIIGIVVVVLIAVLLWGYNSIKMKNIPLDDIH